MLVENNIHIENNVNGILIRIKSNTRISETRPYYKIRKQIRNQRPLLRMNTLITG